MIMRFFCTNKFIFSFLILLITLVISNQVFTQENSKLTDISLKFFVTHPWKKVEGTCKEIKLDRSKITQSGNLFNLALPYNLSCPLINMKTGDTNRDSHMLEVLGYPNSKEITLNITKMKSLPDRKYSLEGELTINSNKKALILIVDEDSSKLGKFSGKFEILLSEFKVERPSLLFVPIDDKVKIEFEVQL